MNSFSDAVWALIFLGLVAIFFQLWYVFVPIAVVGWSYLVIKNLADTPKRREKKAQKLNHDLYNKVVASFPFHDQEDYDDKFVVWAKPLYPYLLTLPEKLQGEMVSVISDLYDREFFQLVPEPPAIADSIPGARYRDTLAKMAVDYSDVEDKRHRAVEVFTKALRQLKIPTKGEYIADVPFSDAESLTEFIVQLYRFDDLFIDLKHQLSENADEVDPKKFTLPSEYKGQNVNWTYLKDTPLLDVFDSYVPYYIDPLMRFEHMWLVAPPGQGKSNAMKSFISRDFDKVAKGEASVIVLESNVDLIKELRRSERFAPGGDLEGKLVYIDAEDVDYPLSINLLDLGVGDSSNLNSRDKAVLNNSARSLLEYIFRSLLGTELTGRQTTLFRECLSLLSHTKNATLDDLLRLLAVDNAFTEHYSKLEPRTRLFFEEKFNQDFKRTRNEVTDRIYSLLNSPVASMITAPTTKINMYEELGSSKVILVNAAKAVLQEDGAELLGRVFIALTLMGLEKRQFDPIENRLPVYFYIDECHDFIANDERIETLLVQARKLRCGMILANQFSSQLKTARSAVENATAIQWSVEPGLPNHTFSAQFRRGTPINIKTALTTFPPGTFDMEAFRGQMRDKYSWIPKQKVYEEPEEEVVDFPGGEVIEGEFRQVADDDDNPPFVPVD